MFFCFFSKERAMFLFSFQHCWDITTTPFILIISYYLHVTIGHFIHECYLQIVVWMLRSWYKLTHFLMDTFNSENNDVIVCTGITFWCWVCTIDFFLFVFALCSMLYCTYSGRCGKVILWYPCVTTVQHQTAGMFVDFFFSFFF